MRPVFISYCLTYPILLKLLYTHFPPLFQKFLNLYPHNVSITPTTTKEEQSLKTKFPILKLRGTNTALQNRQQISCFYLYPYNLIQEIYLVVQEIHVSKEFIDHEISFIFVELYSCSPRYIHHQHFNVLHLFFVERTIKKQYTFLKNQLLLTCLSKQGSTKIKNELA